MLMGMYQPEAGAVERHARQILAKRPSLAGLQIVSIVHRFRQPQVNQADGFEGVGVRGWAPTETKASMAWVRASMPVAAVTAGGMSSITLASSTAISGIRFGSIITSFTCRSSSIIPLLVISAAVPAVLMATSGTPAFFTLPTPE